MVACDQLPEHKSKWITNYSLCLPKWKGWWGYDVHLRHVQCLRVSVLIYMKIVLIRPNRSVWTRWHLALVALLCVTSRAQSCSTFGSAVCTSGNAYTAGQCLPWRQKSIQSKNKSLLNKNGNHRSKQLRCTHCAEKMSWCLSQCRFFIFLSEFCFWLAGKELAVDSQ